MKSGLRISQDEDRPIEYSVDELASPENKPAEKSSTPTPPSPTSPAIFSRTSASGLMSIEFILSASGTSSSTRTNSSTAESEKANLKPISEPKLVAREPDESGNSAAFSTAPHFIVDGFSAALTDAHWSGNLATQQEQGTESLSEEDSEQNPEEDVERVFAAAEQGDADAQCKLGEMCFYGRGVEGDFELAVHWYRKAADQGNADGQLGLGQMYCLGAGVEEDFDQAAHWYGKAAEQGNVKAKLYLAGMYLNGDGVKKNVELGIEWRCALANQGDDDAQFFLGVMYEEGEIVEQDFEKAFQFYKMAADQGKIDGQFALVKMYREGKGVKKNLELATYWKLMSELKADRKEIVFTMKGVNELVQFIPDVLQKYREFEKVTALKIEDFRLDAVGFSGVNQLIRANTFLERLSIQMEDRYEREGDIKIDEAVEMLTSSLQECNTRLTKLDITHGSWGTSNPYALLPRQQIAIVRLLEQNKAITELRNYMQSLPVTTSFTLPLDVLMPLVDQMIVESIRGGTTKEQTKAAVDEFLLSA